MPLQPGDEAPDFTLPDSAGEAWSLSAQRGHAVVLYFYPKDDTTGCTAQACDIRDHWSEFEELGAAVVGISPDTSASHTRFADKYELPHTLLADPDKQVIQGYDAWGEKVNYGKTYMGVIRSSVVIDEDGKVLAVFDKISPKDQSTKSLQALRQR